MVRSPAGDFTISRKQQRHWLMYWTLDRPEEKWSSNHRWDNFTDTVTLFFTAVNPVFRKGNCWWEAELQTSTTCRMQQRCPQVNWAWERTKERGTLVSDKESILTENTSLCILVVLYKNINLLCSNFPFTFYRSCVSYSSTEPLIVCYNL